jgi:hypothetical protein
VTKAIESSLLALVVIGGFFVLTGCNSGGGAVRAGKECSLATPVLSPTADSTATELAADGTSLPAGEYTLREAELSWTKKSADGRDLRLHAKERRSSSGEFAVSFGCLRGWKPSDESTVSVRMASALTVTQVGTMNRIASLLVAESRPFAYKKEGYSWSASFSKSETKELSTLLSAYDAESQLKIYKTAAGYEIRSTVDLDGASVVTRVLYDFEPAALPAVTSR